MIETVKLIVGKYKYPVQMETRGNRLFFSFPYNPDVMAELKIMEGAKWHGFDEVPEKKWSVANTVRNAFQLAFLQGRDVYKYYDAPLLPFTPRRGVKVNPTDPGLRLDQVESCQVVLTRHYCILAEEMGVGKTLELIECGEHIGYHDWWWVGPKSALRAVELEFRKWNALFRPEFMTYEQLVKRIKNWTPGMKAPRFATLDESSKCKTPSAQRSQASLHLANAIRAEHGRDGYVVLMTGSPAPKSPADWWMQCEIACPGYLKEGDINKFKRRLAIISSEESLTGGRYEKIITWKDSELKCDSCGLFKEAPVHDIVQMDPDHHEFKPSKNEINFLYQRLKGLVHVKFKKDCVQLPEKTYRTIECTPSQDVINASRLIALSARSAIEALTLSRELSDGFQYQTDETTGQRTCTEFECPKFDALTDLLDEHDEVKRLVVYAGFTASIDRIARHIVSQGWKVIQVDGRGWVAPEYPGKQPVDLLELFQSDSDERLVFLGHPGSAGMGLTLTASPSIVYFSNDFNAESRIQSEDRIHRPSSRGANIIDLIHLPTDMLVLSNLQKKRDLQAMTLGEMRDAIQAASAVNIRDQILYGA